MTAGGAVVGGIPFRAAAREGPDFGDWFDDVDNYDGISDRRGREAVTVEVGVDANGGPYGYGPAAIRVDPGTTITFEWVSDNHNVLLESGPDGNEWRGHEKFENAGFSYQETPEMEGVYLYYCKPHLGLGMKGAVVVGDIDVALESESSGEETRVDGSTGQETGTDGSQAGSLVGGIVTRLPGSPVASAIVGITLGSLGLSATIALLPDLRTGTVTAGRASRHAGGVVGRWNGFRDRPVGSAAFGLLSVSLILGTIAVGALVLWYSVPGWIGFLIGFAVVAGIALFYAVSSTGVTPSDTVRGRSTNAGGRLPILGSRTRPVFDSIKDRSRFERSISVVRGWAVAGIVLGGLAAVTAALWWITGGGVVFVVALIVMATVVAVYAITGTW